MGLEQVPCRSFRLAQLNHLDAPHKGVASPRHAGYLEVACRKGRIIQAGAVAACCRRGPRKVATHPPQLSRSGCRMNSTPASVSRDATSCISADAQVRHEAIRLPGLSRYAVVQPDIEPHLSQLESNEIGMTGVQWQLEHVIVEPEHPLQVIGPESHAHYAGYHCTLNLQKQDRPVTITGRPSFLHLPGLWP